MKKILSIVFIVVSFLFANKALAETVHLTTKEKVLLAFKDTPRMKHIVQCESRFRQFNYKGKPLLSWSNDVGVMQINKIHWPRAKKLGLDIFHSVDDNIKMGKIILREQGMSAWVCNRLV